MTHRCSLVCSLGLVFGMFVGAAFTPAHAQDQLPAHAVGMIPTGSLSPEVKAAAQTAVRGEGLEKAGGVMGPVGLELALLYYQHQREGAAGVQALRAQATRAPRMKARDSRRPRSQIRFPVSADGRLVAVDAVASGNAGRLLGALRRLGLEQGGQAGSLVSGRLPIRALREAAQLSSLRGMRPSYMRTRVGSVTSEADTAHAVVQVREGRDLDGAGQKVCALSDSYNNSSSALTTASDDVQSGDLPGNGNPEGNTTPVDVLDDGDTDGTDEGRAMLQLIHDIVPGAELGFHTAAGGLGVFVDGIRNFADPTDGDCDVIVDDIGYNIQPFYQDGPVSNVVDSVVAEGTPYFSSAGNDGQNSYEAPFRDSGEPGVISGSSTLHDFDPSSSTDTRQSITIEADGEFQIFSFQWTDPSSIVEGSAGADTDLDVALVDQDGEIQAESSFDNIGSGVPVEGVLEYTNSTSTQQTLDLVIEKAAGPDPDEVKYIYFGTGFQINEYDTLGPTVYGHPNTEGAMAVAAAPFFNTGAYNDSADPAVLEFFSSKGGIPILFDQNGTRLITPEQRQKPNVTGTDGVDNTFFGQDLPSSFADGLDGDPYPNFFGTSAAAPNVAAIAALIQQVRPNLSSTEVYDRLESTAADVVERQNRNGDFVAIASGVDPWSGHGFVLAPEAVPQRDVFDLALAELDPEAETYQLAWREREEVTIDSYQIEQQYFGGPFRPVSGSVTSSGDDRVFDLGNLGLGVFRFRVKWTRSDAPEDTLRRTTAPDTLGFTSVSTALEVPGNVPDPRGRQTVGVSWGVPAGTQGFTYQVERRRGTDGPFEVLGTTSDRSFGAGLQAPGQYSYRIVARDGQGNTLTSPAQDVDLSFDGAAVAIGPYPNPVREDATVDLTVQNAQLVTVEVYNTIGERLYRARRSLRARTARPLTVNAERWSSGVYFLRVRGEDFTKTRKFVVVK